LIRQVVSVGEENILYQKFLEGLLVYQVAFFVFNAHILQTSM